jgi:CRP/FNR family cyclic AMP-dependent transcriptional regulator
VTAKGFASLPGTGRDSRAVSAGEVLADLTPPLARIQLFNGLSQPALDLVASIATEEHHPKGTVLFRVGDPGDALFLILSGRVRISREVPGMGEEALTILGAGDAFGELSIIDSGTRSADAHIHEDAVLIKIKKDAMEHLLFTHRDLAYEVLWNAARLLSARLRDTTDKVTFLAVTGKFS